MNEHQLRQKQKADAQRQFLNGLSSGQVHALDRFGAEVQAGQKVLYRPPFDLIYDVVGVAPLLDPSAPPGLMTVTLSVTVPITVKANELWIPAIVVAQAESKAEPESMDAYRKRRQMEDMRAQEKDPIPQGAEPVAVQGQGEGGDRSNAGELPTEG